MKFKTVVLEDESSAIPRLVLNRPEKANAFNQEMWKELQAAIGYLDDREKTRVIILSGAGKHFSSGIDLSMLEEVLSPDPACPGRAGEKFREFILELQETITSVEKCRKPVIAAISGACFGGGLDLAAACDLRYADRSAKFSVKEAELGITADLGSLQRLPHIVGGALTREWAYTARDILPDEALKCGLVNGLSKDQKSLENQVSEIAGLIASRSPLAVRGIKKTILHARDHSVSGSLDFVATWNAAMLPSSDIYEAMKSRMEGRVPAFRD